MDSWLHASMNDFVVALQKRFEVSKTLIDESIIFNGSTISQNPNGNITMSTETNLPNISFEPDIEMSREDKSHRANIQEIKSYRELADALVWKG